MIIKKTKINGVYILEPELRTDKRGYFTRVFGKDELRKNSIKYDIVQINRSLTKEKGMIRGLHFQKYPKQEDKIVQCLQGSVFDVAIDLRPKSKTYGKWVGKILTAKDMNMFLIPKGFAHGFQALEKNCIVQYFVSEYYSPKYELGIRWNDPKFKIKWPIKKVIVSEKDAGWPEYTK
ncbi:MAG: dTDP-4-dehydrorhamnose 3,5-epimerase [Patescibacteria group bacterium]|nr:dTDP-4-dehydrorhamnose 3,5-epimerase [Patescibacteria group bacterium]